MLKHSGSELSAHETRSAERDRWGSIAQLVAEYEAIAQHAQAEHVATMLADAGLDDEQLLTVVTSEAFGSLVTTLRRAWASGLNPAILTRHAVLSGRLDDVDDLTTLLRYRIQRRADAGPGLRAGVEQQRLHVGLVPRAAGPMTGDLTTALAERGRLIEERADVLLADALAGDEPWIRRCGRPPYDPAGQRAWNECARVIAAYRELHDVDGEDPVGAIPRDDRDRIDYHRAEQALRRAQTLLGPPHRHRHPSHDLPTINVAER